LRRLLPVGRRLVQNLVVHLPQARLWQRWAIRGLPAILVAGSAE
jgi:hypothetical protein